MQLADLLVREGYSSRDVPALLSWALARADALLQTIDSDSPVGVLLDGLPRHVVKDSPVVARGSVDHNSSRSSSDDDLAADEDVVDELPVDLRRAVTAATTSSPQPAAPAYVDDDPDSGFGGFARFQSLLKLNRPYPYRSQEPVADERPTLARSFALAGEREADRVQPSSPPPDLSATLPLAAALGISSEESAALVLGIPDEDTGEHSGLSALFDPDAGPDIVDSLPLSMAPRMSSSSRTSASAAGFIDDDDVPLPTVRRGTGTARMATLVDDDDAPLRSPVRDDDDESMSSRLVDDDDVALPDPSPLMDDDESPLGSGALLDDDDLPLGAGLTDDDDEVPPPPPRHGALVEHEGGPPPVRLAASSLLDDDDDVPPSSAPPPTIATELDDDETIAEPLRTRDTPPMPGLPAIDIDAENGAPVLRHRTPKKKVVELGAPVAKPRGGSGASAVSPRGPGPKPPPPRKPPPPPARKPPPPPVDDDIQELSRVELIEDLPSYLRDDDE
ncbi:hypothetical protein [Nannocystis pusilla]|uniref:Uncharacterized protein n=1 Tax=Nannocystis pusilla TaxID=889268 RepID=A0ABS7TSK2_9BACT|nr:hypothetical protein [Nannocystis pusilla]MBZ5711198.1 hypothetical protein [Nannocystis pusilla]